MSTRSRDEFSERLKRTIAERAAYTDAAIEWKDGFSLKKVKGTEIKLKFELRESKIYSFSFAK